MRIAINGFGRIGRAVFRIALEKGYNVVAINDLTDIENLVYLLKHDSVYGKYGKKVSHGENFIKVGNKKVVVCSEKDPLFLPWKKLKVDVAIEATGFFRDRDGAGKHLKAGAKRVVISAPGKDVDKMIVLGINEKNLKKNDKIISMASCTTNCLAPVAKVLDDTFGIKQGFMTTIHAYTNDQKILDVPHKDFRRGRAAAQNFIPTSSGATKAVCEVIPSLKGKMDGLAIRGPIACGSIVDFVVTLKKSATKKSINAAMKKAANGKMKGILKYSEDDMVSSDVVGDSHSSIFDSKLTQANGKVVKVLSWYDNEFGYSSRLVDLLGKLR
ncbi:type I glyceraldehyde-3-phosphate dehydrogenase [archaeon]|nr:type I glyceraldehyde-3-phosphate dehydrogenase [archaeon]